MPGDIEGARAAGGSFRFGEWFVEPVSNPLSNGDTMARLELKVMDDLLCLAERAGDVVTRQEIIDRVG
jgi:DNA-binding winged helix-turn-helix (wHTH) protein